MADEKRTLGAVAALGSAASWAIGALLFDRIADRMGSLAMTLTKSALSVVLLAVTVVIVEAFRREERSLLGWWREVDSKSLGLLAISGVLGISVADTCFFEALHSLSAHLVVVMMMVGFILTPMLAMLFLKERSSGARWLGVLLVVEGVGIVVASNPEGQQLASRMRGLLFGLMAVVSMSVSYVIAKKALESMSALQGTFVRMLFGTAGMFAFGVLTGRMGAWVVPLSEPGFVAFFVVAVCVVTFGGFWFTHVAIKNMDLTIANTLMATEPLFVLVLGACFLGQPVTLMACLGSLVAVQGVAVLLKSSAQPLAVTVEGEEEGS